MNSRSLMLLPLLCVCACSPLINNKEETPVIAEDTNTVYTIELTSGKLEVYIFNSYGSVAYYHEFETYDAPLTLDSYVNSFVVNKDNVSYYYSIPMFQYYLSLES